MNSKIYKGIFCLNLNYSEKKCSPSLTQTQLDWYATRNQARVVDAHIHNYIMLVISNLPSSWIWSLMVESHKFESHQRFCRSSLSQMVSLLQFTSLLCCVDTCMREIFSVCISNSDCKLHSRKKIAQHYQYLPSFR